MNNTIFGTLFAVIAAVSFALWNVFLQRALQRGASVKLSLVTFNLINISLFVPAVTILWQAGALPPFNLAGIGWYAAAALMTAVLGPFFTAKATARIGVSVTTALRLLDAVFAVLLAILLLGEHLNKQVGVGIALIILALLLLQVVGQKNDTTTRLDRAGVGFAILSSMTFTIGSVVRKLGLLLIPSAFVGTLMEGLVGLFSTALMMNRRNWGELRQAFTTESRDLWLSGLSATIGTLCLNLALQRVPVPVAVALRNTSPWFALLLVPWLIGKAARPGLKLWTSTAVMTAGMLLIVLR